MVPGFQTPVSRGKRVATAAPRAFDVARACVEATIMRSMILEHGTCLCEARLMPISEKHDFSIAWPHLPAERGQNVSRFVGCCPSFLIRQLRWFETWFLADKSVAMPTPVKMKVMGVIHEALTQLFLLAGLVPEAMEQQMRLSEQHLAAADTAAQRRCLVVVSNLARTHARDACYTLLDAANAYAKVATMLGTRCMVQLPVDEFLAVVATLCAARESIVAACVRGEFRDDRPLKTGLFGVICRLLALHARVIVIALECPFTLDAMHGETVADRLTARRRLASNFVKYLDTVGKQVMAVENKRLQKRYYDYVPGFYVRLLSMVFRCEVFDVLAVSDAYRIDNVEKIEKHLLCVARVLSPGDFRMTEQCAVLHRQAMPAIALYSVAPV
jgi:hypothetical protein